MALDRRGIQIGVAILPTLAGEPLERVTMAIAEAWRPGDDERDNGALIAVFVNDRKVRIEVGYGLEPHVTDAAAGRIIRHRMTPEFRRGLFGQGVMTGINAIALLADGQDLPPEETTRPEDGSSIIPILLIVAFIVLLNLRRRHPSIWIGGGGWGRGGGGGFGGRGSGGGSFGGGSFGGGGASGSW